MLGAAGIGAAVEAAREQVFAAASDEQILSALESVRVLTNQASALQFRLLAEVARREDVRCEDGTVEQRRRAPGFVAIDAASLVCEALGVSEAVAGARIEPRVHGRRRQVADDRDARFRGGLLDAYVRFGGAG